MRMVICDRCGARIYTNPGYVALNLRDKDVDDIIDGNPYEHNDYCPECMQDIKRCIEAPARREEPEKTQGWSIPEFFKEDPESWAEEE